MSYNCAYCLDCHKTFKLHTKFCPYCGSSKVGVECRTLGRITRYDDKGVCIDEIKVDYTDAYRIFLSFSSFLDSSFRKIDGFTYVHSLPTSSDYYGHSVGDVYDGELHKIKILSVNYHGSKYLIIRDYKRLKSKNVFRKVSQIVLPERFCFNYLLEFQNMLDSHSLVTFDE